MGRYPQRQRVAAYAVVIRDEQILLSRLAPHIAGGELWALPGGGLDHGEDPGRAVVREIYEETGLHASVSREARVYSMHNPRAHHGDGGADYHALRIVFEGWVPVDSPEPRVIEVDGSTVAAGWHPLADVRSGKVPVTDLVHQALRGHEPFQMQRLAAYALVRRDDTVLLTRISDRGHLPGTWTLPGGGIDHGEKPSRPCAARSTRSAASTARSASCSASTTCTSPAPPRPVGTRTTTACTWSSPPRWRPTPSPASSRSAAPPTRPRGCR